MSGSPMGGCVASVLFIRSGRGVVSMPVSPTYGGMASVPISPSIETFAALNISIFMSFLGTRDTCHS